MRIVHGVDIGRLAVRESCVRAVLEQEFFAASTCPPTDAVMSADMPSDRTLLASTSFFRSDFMTLDRPPEEHGPCERELPLVSTR
jgi:hypothetical protein